VISSVVSLPSRSTEAIRRRVGIGTGALTSISGLPVPPHLHNPVVIQVVTTRDGPQDCPQDSWSLRLTQARRRAGPDRGGAGRQGQRGPLADRIHSSKIHNLKELRPRTGGQGQVRLLFVFDADREAIVLVARGQGRQWNRWYAGAIPLAEERYAAYRRGQEEA
jgi:hypothetical protein